MMKFQEAMIYDLQKASLTKRISAFLFDLVTLAVIFTGCMLLISTICGYDGKTQALSDRMTEIHEDFGIAELEKEHSVTFNDFQYMTEEERAKLPESLVSTFNAYNDALTQDTKIIFLYETVFTLSLMIVSLSLLAAFLVVDFAVPLYFKNGQTLGKKIFGIAVMQTDGVKLPVKTLFIRTVLGKYTIGAMVPALMLLSLLFGGSPIMPLTVILAILLIQVVMLITTKTNSLIHDTLSATVVVDFQSQMIFESAKDKEEYVLRIHRENAEKADY